MSDGQTDRARDDIGITLILVDLVFKSDFTAISGFNLFLLIDSFEVAFNTEKAVIKQHFLCS